LTPIQIKLSLKKEDDLEEKKLFKGLSNKELSVLVKSIEKERASRFYCTSFFDI